MSRRRKIFVYVAAAIAGLVLVLLSSIVLILPSDWFRDKVRARIVAEVERASGGRAEVGSFRFDWTTLTAEVAPFVLHGTEPPSEAPLFRAESVTVELKVVSVLKHDIDIASLRVEQPKVNILIDEHGVTNFPRPKIPRPQGRDPVEQLLALAIRDITLRNGTLHYGDRKLPLDIRGRYLRAKLAYDFNGPSYRGALSMEEMTIDAGPALPMTFAFDSNIVLARNRIDIPRAHLSMKETGIEVAGSIEDFKSPRMAFDVNGTGSLSELGKPLRLPVQHVGKVNFSGKVTYNKEENLRIAGRVTGQHLAFREGRVHLDEISMAADLDMNTEQVRLRGATVHALDGVFRGMVDIQDFRSFKVNGDLTGVSVRSLTQMTGFSRAGFSGLVAGPVAVTGTFTSTRDLRAGGRFRVAASQGGVPVQGFVEVAYNGRTRAVQLGNSKLSLPSSSVQFSGTFGEKLQVRLESKDLNDLLPALAFASDEPPPELPLRLNQGGSAIFDGTVSGPVNRAELNGQVTLSGITVRDQQIDRVVATVAANSNSLHVRSFTLGQDVLRLSGSFDATLNGWRLTDASDVVGNLRLKDARLRTLLAMVGQKLPAEGLVDAEVSLTGTAGDPKADVQVVVSDLTLHGEKFNRVRGRVRYQSAGVEVIDAVAESGASRILLSGTYRHGPGDYRNGRVEFRVETERWTLEQVNTLRSTQPGLEGEITITGSGTVAIRNGELLPESLNGNIGFRNLVVDGRALGDFTVDARTTGTQMALGMSGVLRGSKVTGNATFQLTGDYPGQGSLSFSPMPIGTLQDLLLVARQKEPLPLEGFVSANVTFSGPAKVPEQMRARIELPLLEVVPARRTLTAKQRADLSFRNQGPLLFEFDGKAVHVRQARLVGGDTDLTISGTMQPFTKQPWDVRVVGNLNVGVLQNFREDVVSSGAAVINATIRGSLQDPQFSGRMELRNASFYLADLPNGFDDANGVIVFDQRRASIEKLRATTGGGEVGITGFVGFGGNELVYQLQARAERVRIRYPEGVSTTTNASVTLTGTTSKSLLSGTVTIMRAGFNPKTDIASILSSTPTPVVGAANQNPFLRGMQFDVRIETVPNLQFQTALTADLQAEADLRLRGTAAKPVLLGRVLVSQGEIQFFGTRYTINRGEIAFFNPVRIEPVVNLDLETRVRGVLVNISFNGPLQRLNVSYRSDPPLQSNEIIALLAVGRAPGSNASFASSQTVSSQAFLGSSTNSLLGQAVAAPISSRLQRFFGVSRLKIDPQLTGLSAVPQARLTVEQQISRDITLTYVTNLSQANQQIIRLEWNINRNWSVVAVREENGVFGVDFFFKKRFR